MKINQTGKELLEEVRAVARGDRPASPRPAEPAGAENPETEVATPIVLTHRESEQLQDMMDSPRPRSPKFEEAMARHERRSNESTEAIQRSNSKEL